MPHRTYREYLLEGRGRDFPYGLREGKTNLSGNVHFENADL